MHAFGATLHGSLTFIGKGHATDRAVILGLCRLVPDTMDREGLGELRFDPASDLVFDYDEALPLHANGMVLKCFAVSNREVRHPMAI